MRVNKKLCLQGMAWLSVVATVATVALRSWLLPTLRDGDTGLFASGTAVIALLVAVLVALAVLGYLGRGNRREVVSPASMWVSVSLLLGGGLVLVSSLWDVWQWVSLETLPAPVASADSTLGLVAAALQVALGTLGGGVLVCLGLELLSEGSTRRGMAGWSMLMPVLYLWVRLARYEMSYVSAVRLSQSFYDVLMFVLELLFLFALARYITGAGKVGAGRMQFLSCATAVFALSAPLVRLVMYLIGDTAAYAADVSVGLVDVGVGILALVLAFALPCGAVEVQVSVFAEESSEEFVEDCLSTEEERVE